MKNYLNYLVLCLLVVSFVTFSACGDDDTAPEPVIYTATLSTDNTIVSESNTGLSFVVTLDKANTSGGALSINYEITGTATSGTDYPTPFGPVSISTGDRSGTLQISLIDDSEIEDDETLTVSLVVEDPVVLGDPNSITVFIQDND